MTRLDPPFRVQPSDVPALLSAHAEGVVRLDGMTHRVGPKGQVVIPKELRDELGIEADHPMAFADAFAAALAVSASAELWTGDPGLLIDDAAWLWVDLRSAG